VKNATLTRRNVPAAVLQVLAIFIFILLIYGVAMAIEQQNRSKARYQDVIAPAQYLVPGIPDCASSFFMEKSCYTLLWAPNTDPVASSIAANIAANNVPPIPANRIMSFATADAANAWVQLAGNFGTSMGVLEFIPNYAAESVDFGIQFVRAPASLDRTRAPCLRFPTLRTLRPRLSEASPRTTSRSR